VHRASHQSSQNKKFSLLHSFTPLLYYTALRYLLLCIVHRDSPHQRATTSCFTSCFTGCRHASLSLKRTSRKSTRFTSFTSFTHLITILNSSRFTGFTASQWPLNFVHLERPRRPPPPRLRKVRQHGLPYDFRGSRCSCCRACCGSCCSCCRAGRACRKRLLPCFFF